MVLLLSLLFNLRFLFGVGRGVSPVTPWCCHVCSRSRAGRFVQGEGARGAPCQGRVQLGTPEQLRWETRGVVLGGLQLEIGWKLKMLM